MSASARASRRDDKVLQKLRMVVTNARQALGLSLVLFCSLAVCCKHDRTDAAATNRQTAPQPAPAATAPSPKPTATPRGLPPHIRLAIVPGQGMGPIRLGANVGTLERLMQQPCEEKTDSVCRFITKGVEYELKDGVTQAIQLHRPGRQVTAPGQHSPETYGVLNAAIAPNVTLGMLPKWVEKALGRPKKVEAVADGGVNRTVARHFYDGLVLEYDINPKNGAEILAGIRIVKEASGAQGTSAAFRSK
ncbi:MAG: hypothetical protein JW940_25530 [Polyangiaceae bacterium]|nr:hypothetical protein [Polyangiaceae bacterium]